MERYLSATPQATVLLIIFLTAFSVNVFIYLFRLICSLIWREKRSYRYGGLWGLPYGLLLLLGIHPPGTFNHPMLEICLFLWLFALFCAIIRLKISSALTWRLLLEDRMKRFFNGIAVTRRWILKAGGWLQRLSLIPLFIDGLIIFLTLLMVVGITTWVPVLAVPTLGVFYSGILLRGLYESVHSCKKLLVVWFWGGALVAFAGAGAVFDCLPNDIVNEPIAYAAFIVIVAFCWSITGLIADYDVAKMASGIVNAGTTILVLAVNVVFAWCKMNLQVPIPEWDFDYLIYGCNIILLPMVAAGFLTAILVEGQEYYKKKYWSDNIEEE